MAIRIHNFERGVRGLRVVWLCEEMGVPWELATVSYPPSDAYRALHPLGTVPFLEDGDVRMSESVAMLLWIARRHGPTPLLPEEPAAQARVLELAVMSEATIGAQINGLLMTKFAAPDGEKATWLARALEERTARAIDLVAERLGAGPFLAGDAFTLADIAVSTTLGMWKGVLGKELPASLVAWRERLAERPAYQRAAKTQKPR